METACANLDDLLVKYFNILEKFADAREQLQALMKEGYYRLSKARYSMGNKAVSSMQYDVNKMQALATITLSHDETDDRHMFELVRKKPSKARRKTALSEDEYSSTIGSTEVRKRKGGEDEVAVLRLEELTINDDSTAPDPLRWFGVLVPPTLRQGQSNFIQAVEVSVELANLQSELEATRLKYRELLGKKSELMKSEAVHRQLSDVEENN